jgi:hypothetical protein
MAKASEKHQDFVDIALRRPMTIDGAEVKALRMREPTVEDQLAASALKLSEEETEIAMMANLCQVTPADLKRLTIHDYKKVQVAFFGFTV